MFASRKMANVEIAISAARGHASRKVKISLVLAENSEAS